MYVEDGAYKELLEKLEKQKRIIERLKSELKEIHACAKSAALFLDSIDY